MAAGPARAASICTNVSAPASFSVQHQTRRMGRPHTLVLTKTDVLFEDELRQRRYDEQDLAWITS